MGKRKWIYGFVVLLLLVAVVIKVLAWQGEKSFKALTEKTLEAFHRDSGLKTEDAYDESDFSTLPKAVRVYLQKAMPKKGVPIGRVKIEQKGEMRVHDEASFEPFTAVQYVSQGTPRMMWAGSVKYWPLTDLKILTAWIQPGEGETSSFLWGLVPAFKKTGAEMKAYLMARWLAEAVWYPTALLPSDRISWEPVKSRQPEVIQARVRFTDGDMTVSGIFTFMKSNGAPLMFTVEDGAMPAFSIYRWYCSYSEWSRYGDFQVPRELTEGVIHGGLPDARLKITVSGIDFKK